MKSLLILILLFSSICHAQNDKSKESSVSETAKGVVSNIVTFGKNLVDGASDGVTEGRKEGQSKDGAIVISNLEELEKNIELKVLSVSGTDDGFTEIEVGFKNDNTKPVRVIKLAEAESVLVIDNDGYANNIAIGKNNPTEITIPNNAGRKVKFVFKVQQKSVKEIRILGKTLSK